jgi:hypothetical protein
MRTVTLSFLLLVLATVSSFIAKATQSVGYKLWDSNSGRNLTGSFTATLDTLDLGSVQVSHIQIKFDGAIFIPNDAAALAEQMVIDLPAINNRTKEFGVNALDATILDITLTGDGTAQQNCVLTIRAADPSGLIPGIVDGAGNAVTLVPISSIQPTGLALEELNSTTGTATTPADVVYRLSSIPLVRSMNFLQARSTVSQNPNGYLGQESFTIHSHMYDTMLARVHISRLVATATTTLQSAGYTFQKIDGDNADNPHIKLTATTPIEGEKLSWVVYHYPYRAAADRKFELAEALTGATADPLVIEAANAVLYNTEATAADVAAAIASLNAVANDISPLETAPLRMAFGGNRSVILQNLTPGSIITLYQTNGRIAATVVAKSDAETIAVPAAGIYIVRVNDLATKLLIK